MVCQIVRNQTEQSLKLLILRLKLKLTHSAGSVYTTLYPGLCQAHGMRGTSIQILKLKFCSTTVKLLWYWKFLHYTFIRPFLVSHFTPKFHFKFVFIYVTTICLIFYKNENWSILSFKLHNSFCPSIIDVLISFLVKHLLHLLPSEHVLDIT